MRIKYWLMISFIVIMLLPVVTLYFLYQSISTYGEQQDLLEFIEVSNRAQSMEQMLQDPNLYTTQSESFYEPIKKAAKSTVKIDLYRHDGILLYSTMASTAYTRFLRTNVEDHYKNLNEFEKKHRTYTLKRPVLEKDRLIGFYQLTFSRDDWLTNVRNKSYITAVSFGLFIIILYGIMLFLLNRKLNRPLLELQQRMSTFAAGKQLPPTRKQHHDELGELHAHFEKMREQITATQSQLKKQQEEKEFIVATLSHDLKTPLTVIQAYCEALLKENSNLSAHEKAEYQTVLFDKITHMKKLLHDLATYTSLQSGTYEISVVEVDGEEFFEMLLAGYDEACAQKNIQLTVEQHAYGPYGVHVNNMIRVIDNLMENAMRYTAADKKIWLAAIHSTSSLPHWIFQSFTEEIDEWRKGNTLIIVQNEGEAIPPDQQQRVFEPFYQVAEMRNTGGTSGLGLSITKSLLEQQGGKLKLVSSPLHGTIVMCLLKEGEGKND